MRKRFLDDLERIERGEDPKAIVRDPAQNVCIEMPLIERELYTEGLPLAEMLADPAIDPRRDYPFQIGQPEAVRRAYLDALGLTVDAIADRGTDHLLSAAAKNSRRIWT